MTDQTGMDSAATGCAAQIPAHAATPDAPLMPLTDGVPQDIDTAVPNVARIYDFLLGGEQNFASDRQAAEELMRLVPEALTATRDNRQFLQRAVGFLARDAGIRQFIDIGTGLPTQGNVHEMAQRARPESRVLYVDNDPIVISHAQALLADNSTVIAINRDLRRPREILDHPALRALINLDEPVAILLVAILHFIRSDEDPYGIVNEIKDALPRGSYLVLSHATADHVSESVAQRIRQLYDRASVSAVARSRAEIASFLDGFDMVPPGLVSVSSWRTANAVAEADRVIFYAAVGMKR